MEGKEGDPDKHKALYNRFQRVIATELPVCHVNSLPSHTVATEKVMDFPQGIWGTSTPIDMVWLKE